MFLNSNTSFQKSRLLNDTGIKVATTKSELILYITIIWGEEGLFLIFFFTMEIVFQSK